MNPSNTGLKALYALLGPALLCALSLAAPARAALLTVGFEEDPAPLNGGLFVTYVYTEQGMSFDNPYAGGHFDIYNRAADFPATTGSQTAGIHNGNNGSDILITHQDGVFDMISLDLVAWNTTGVNPSVTTDLLTITSSAGGSVLLDSTFTGILDFTALTGFEDIDWLRMEMPDRSLSCTVNGSICYGAVFDQFTFRVGEEEIPVPAPTALWLAGLIGLLARRARTKSRVR
ncbi:MAG: hypothetical protein ACPGU7_14395 [Gammaproteobacteria bacterium]